MKILQKCERCGNDIKHDKDTNLEFIKCPHCNKEYEISKETDKKIFRSLIVLIIILALLASFIQQIFSLSFFLVLIPMILVGLYARRFLTWVFFKLDKLTYTEKL